jgi:hypothetical protein
VNISLYLIFQCIPLSHSLPHNKDDVWLPSVNSTPLTLTPRIPAAPIKELLQTLKAMMPKLTAGRMAYPCLDIYVLLYFENIEKA